VSTAAPAEVQAAAEGQDGVVGAVRRRARALRSGDVGSLPVIVGLVVITIFFTSKTSVFFTALNFDNLVVQMAGVTTIAVGVVFVLLLGEIDLSIGFLSGVAGVVAAELQKPGSSHDYPGLVAIALAIVAGAAIGAFQGSFVAFLGVPSFVVTLAGLLAWQGVIIKALGSEGVIGIQDKTINGVANYFLPHWGGWAIAGAVTAGYVGAAAGGWIARRRAGLRTGSITLLLLRVGFYAGLAWVVVAVCNHSRGVPFAGVLIVALVVFWTYVATRTTFGRHVYAVGGNAEAARRAGINVALIRILVFMISGAMSALGGIVFASRLNSVDLTAGGGTILLDAIAAAVIGGTSLFGGRGYVKSALFGALIIATIANGIDLVGYSESTKYITTGVILLAAVTLDTVSRRRLAASGR
jgi:D-xylose transport system permease protein